MSCESSAIVPAVPPRRGQRVKSRILPPFNKGAAFQVVHLRSEDAFGIVARYDADSCDVWVEHELTTRKISTIDLAFVALPTVPSKAYEEYEAVIGGVGKHNRWYVIMAGCALSELCVSGISDRAVFKHFVDTRLRPFGMSNYEFACDADGTFSTTVHVPDPSKAGMVAAALHCADYEARLADPAARGKLCIERYDRSEHMWWNQTQEKAGPLRDTHRWRYDYIPASWGHIPFTWQSLCKNISLDAETEAACLPRPLRDYYLTHCIQKASDATLAARLEQLRDLPSVTCRLTVAQNHQLLTAGYWNTIAPFDANTLRIARLVRYRYMLHGYTCREIGKYNQNATNLGHGHGIRKFKNKPQYDRANLPVATLNMICQPDGTMRGSGFKGTRGKYGHALFKKYEPRKRMRRTRRQEENMRKSASNALREYEEQCMQPATAPPV